MKSEDQEGLFAKNAADQAEGPVECLGMTFESDEARREHFSAILGEKLKDPEFRRIEGFPIGKDEDILALSDPPYYTACPNPFLEDFVKRYGKPYDPDQQYNRKPFAVDVSQGKTDPLYRAHSYHTKVPHLAIVPSILHYTEPGDVILDGFCGSGMIGVAAQWCGAAPENYRRELEAVWEQEGLGKPCWGLRRAVLNDLSPAATFISANYNLPFEVEDFAMAGKQLLKEIDEELGWMYETLHSDGKSKGRIEYVVWSEVFACPECLNEVVFLNEALDKTTKRVKEFFQCPHCQVQVTKGSLQRVFETRIDVDREHTWKRIKMRPLLISYVLKGHRYEKTVDAHDLELLDRIERIPLPLPIPKNAFPFDDMWDAPRLRGKGFTHVHHLFFPRSAHALGALWAKADRIKDTVVRHALLFFVEQAIWGMSVMNRYQPIQHGRIGGSQVNRQLTGAYYVGSQISEVSPEYNLKNKLGRLAKAFALQVARQGASIIATGTGGKLGLPANSIDYIFTDPPFGDNYPYAELNFLVECWHRVVTNPLPEAIVDRAKKNKAAQKSISDYQRHMAACFEEFYRVLRHGRWMTLVFSNSKNAIWGAIQESLQQAGFVIADVRTLDKQQGSFKQVMSASAVKQDLIISCYKPNGGLEDRFGLEAGTEEGVWDFVRTHLRQLPVFVAKEGKAEVIAERQNYLLFDRMVAFHVQRGVTVPLSAGDFYQGLPQRFPERDGMFFLPEQAAEYDRKRMTVREILQLDLFVKDEATAIQWLRQQLSRKPQTFQELHPQFMKELGGWEKHEKPLELSDLLDQNFLRYDGRGEVPSQIHSYLSTNFKDLRSLAKDDPSLRSKAKDRYYVADSNKLADLERLRERSLLREFDEYRESKQKRLKVFRLEAVRAGFKKAWQEREYATIIEVAKKIPENVLQEDQKLLMWYGNALTRTGE